MICGHCKREGAILRCSRCKSAFYCDRACQQRHWPAHKPSCKAGGLRETDTGVNKEVRNGGGLPQHLEGRPVVVQEKRAELTGEVFPEGLGDFLYQRSADGVEENLLIMLHGLGDTCKP
jgi:hypothetical protein